MCHKPNLLKRNCLKRVQTSKSSSSEDKNKQYDLLVLTVQCVTVSLLLYAAA